jgi:hypothetical protein
MMNARHTFFIAAVVNAEVGDGLEVGRQATDEPHQLKIPARLLLEPA